MKKFKTYIIVISLVIILAYGLFYYVMNHNMGSGSEEFADKWKIIFTDKADLETLKKIDARVKKFDLQNDQWIMGISDNSHNAPAGGTIVTIDNNDQIKVFMGHVCGNNYLSHFAKSRYTLEQIYEKMADQLKEKQ